MCAVLVRADFLKIWSVFVVVWRFGDVETVGRIVCVSNTVIMLNSVLLVYY